MAVKRSSSKTTKRKKKPIEEEVYFVDAQVRNAQKGSYVQLHDEDGNVYSVWPSDRNEGLFNLAKSVAGWTCDVKYFINGDWRNIVDLEKLEQVQEESDSSGTGSEDVVSKQVSIEAQACVKTASQMITDAPDLFFDDVPSVNYGEIVSLVGELSLSLAEKVNNTKAFLAGEDVERTEEEEDEIEDEDELEDEEIETDYEEEEFKDEEKKAPKKKTKRSKGKK